MDNQETIQAFIKGIDTTTIGELSNSRNTLPFADGKGYLDIYVHRYSDDTCTGKIEIHAPNQIVKTTHVYSENIAQFRADLYLELIASFVYIGAVILCDTLIDNVGDIK